MKCKAINDLYNGKISLWDAPLSDSKLFAEVKKQANVRYDSLLTHLDKEGQGALEAFLDANNEMNALYEEDKFKLGFTLGARLMLETICCDA